MLNLTEKETFYDRFAQEFDSKMNMYDTRKRLSVVFDELLTEDLTHKKLLDGGCGTGWFSASAVARGAETYSMDVGDNLLEKVKSKCNSHLVVGSILDIPFADNFSDIVVSSEVIEYTPVPLNAISEFARVLKPGGIIVVTTPNKLWYFAVYLAQLFKLRPYQGLENWVSPYALRAAFKKNGLVVEKHIGIHLFPFVHPIFYPVLDFFHHFRKLLMPVMLNTAIKATKAT
jgi:ubiquinone/menaquinone biosynthesis C-methylase UbiE